MTRSASEWAHDVVDSFENEDAESLRLKIAKALTEFANERTKELDCGKPDGPMDDLCCRYHRTKVEIEELQAQLKEYEEGFWGRATARALAKLKKVEAELSQMHTNHYNCHEYEAQLTSKDAQVERMKMFYQKEMGDKVAEIERMKRVVKMAEEAECCEIWEMKHTCHLTDLRKAAIDALTDLTKENHEAK